MTHGRWKYCHNYPGYLGFETENSHTNRCSVTVSIDDFLWYIRRWESSHCDDQHTTTIHTEAWYTATLTTGRNNIRDIVFFFWGSGGGMGWGGVGWGGLGIWGSNRWYNPIPRQKSGAQSMMNFNTWSTHRCLARKWRQLAANGGNTQISQMCILIRKKKNKKKTWHYIRILMLSSLGKCRPGCHITGNQCSSRPIPLDIPNKVSGSQRIDCSCYHGLLTHHLLVLHICITKLCHDCLGGAKPSSKPMMTSYQSFPREHK